MKLRIARHTDQLEAIRAFYLDVLGLNLIGDFKDHDQYNGFFCQGESQSWHLEFTSSNEKAQHQFDEDDLLVFYIEEQDQLDEMLRKLRSNNSPEVPAKNPWWQNHGHTFLDPDGYRIVICKSKL